MPRTFRPYRIIFSCIFLSIYFIILFCSCKTYDRDKDGIEDAKDSCPDVYAKTKSGCPIEKEIENVHFYIDNSASMMGYFNNNAEFNEIVSDITAKINKEIRPIEIYFIADSVIKYNKAVQNFSDDIAQTPPANQKSSQLQNIIGKISNLNDSNDVSLLVSDCILSFPDNAIKNNPEINKQKASSTLKNDIYQSFYDLKSKGIATSVYAFISKFYGTYYDYQNNKIPLKGEERPFYIWVIADKALLPKFNASLNDISSFKPKQSLHFGLTENPITQFDIVSQIERKGDWMWNKSSSLIEGIKAKNTEQQFCIALNIKDLPSYVQDVNYLQKNLHIESNGCAVTAEVKNKNAIDNSKLKSTQQKKIYENATHFVIFKINSMNLPEAAVHVTLPLQYDTWYLDWSCMDDKRLDSLRNKTFALQYLINGVKEAYETKNKNYIDFSLKLKQ